MSEMPARVYDQFGEPAVLSLQDRGLAYGDGVFETMRVHEAGVPLLERHVRRLRHGLQTLAMPDVAATTLTTRAVEWAEGASRAVLKVIVTRGEGGRGYLPPTRADVRMIVSLHPAPDFLDVVYGSGLRLGTPSRGLTVNPRLAGLKHLNRLEQVLARQEMDQQGWDEGLMFDAEGVLVEAISANVLVARGGRVRVPAHAGAGVAGVMVGWCMDWCRDAGIPVEPARLTRADVLAADELLLCNAVRGVMHVSCWEDRQWTERELCLRLLTATRAAGLGF